MAKTVLCILCLIVAVFAILVDNWDSTAYAQNEPNKIFWDENRPLKWSDYHGVPGTYPDDYVGDRSDVYGAYTYTKIPFQWKSQITQNQPCMYTITQFDADAYFVQNLSWVQSELTSDMFLLNHEQKHFDVSEVHARKFNQVVAVEFLGKQFACPSFSGQSQNDVINEKIVQDLLPVHEQIIQEIIQMNLDYDTQTNHGTVPTMQKKWADYIANLVDYYEPFKDIQETSLTQEEIETNFPQPPLPPIFPEGGTDLQQYWDEYCKTEYGDNYFYVSEKNICTIADEQELPTSGGCLIATATFGSELAPQVQLLREIRDNTVLGTQTGTSFMAAFNTFYYSFSPTVADLERQNPLFKEAVGVAITPLLSSLLLLKYVDIDSEQEMLSYGIGVILLNIGMYFVAPAILILKFKPILRTKWN